MLIAVSLIAQQAFRFVAPDKSFEASFPGQPKHAQKMSESGPFHIEQHSYSFENSEAKFVLSYLRMTPYPTDLKASDALDGAISGTIDNVSGTLLTKESVTLRGKAAKAVQISVGEDTIIDGRFVCVKPRLYQLLVIHRKGAQPPFQQQFFDSFTVPN
ncbi:MAG: hypothetical protein ACHP8B_01210 [Terriglobales bacterium]